MTADFCGLSLDETQGLAVTPGDPRLSKRQQDDLILQFMYWQDAGARPLPLNLGQKYPGKGWRNPQSPTVDVFSDLVRGNQTHGIGVPLSESDVVIDIEGRARSMLSAVEADARQTDRALLRRAVEGLTEETPTGGLHSQARPSVLCDNDSEGGVA
jgi:hypothetical protein